MRVGIAEDTQITILKQVNLLASPSLKFARVSSLVLLRSAAIALFSHGSFPCSKMLLVLPLCQVFRPQRKLGNRPCPQRPPSLMGKSGMRTVLFNSVE